jgi:methyl-accepting chemotaxis protein
MRERLELKILTLVLVLLVIGILAAGIMVLTIEKKSLFIITGSSLESTANIIAKDIARTMLDGKAEVTRDLMQELRGIRGIEELAVIHYNGRNAFSPDTTTKEADVMKQIAETRLPLQVHDIKKMTFYRPLENEDRCKACHMNDPAILGAVKISLSIEKEYNRAVKLIWLVIGLTILASILFSGVLWYMIRRMVINPVKAVEQAAQKLTDGDMSFNVEVTSGDEIGRASSAIKRSMFSLSDILKRIKDITRRVNHLVQEVEGESRKVIEGAVLETEAIGNISSSVEEMNAAISDIADGTDGLAASAEQTAASMEEMVTSIAGINNSTQDLSAAVDATSSSIEELSATIKEVANNSTELASAAQETQSAIMEIASSVREVERRSKESAALSEQVKRDAATFGMTSIEKTIRGMQHIRQSVEKTADYIQKLGGRSEEIGKILNVIDDITDQTTLLALNAAILAAQAGEHGKGFSVVADEIKQLADRTSLSTQEIGNLIQSVQQEVSDAIDAMKEGFKSVETGFKVTSEAADALRKIVESSTRSSEMSAAIERSTAEQSQATGLVSQAMDRVLSMVSQIAKATTEQSKGIQLIMSATEKIRDISGHVRTATNEQSLNSKQISQAIEVVSDKSQQISRAINEQKLGSNQIWMSIEKIKDVPKVNKDRSFKLNQLVKDVHKDAELASTEMERFTFADETASGVFRMGVVPLEAPAVMFKKFSPLAEYLSKVLKRRVDLKVAVDFEDAIRDLEQGITQFCFMGPSTYITAHARFGANVLVKALNDGKPFHHAVIVTREDSGINNLEDIKGRSFAFGDINSTSSHIVPRTMLLAADIDLKDLLFYKYLGHHEEVLRAVLNGDFDAGGAMEAVAVRYGEKGIKLLKFSEDIPEFNICAANSIDVTIMAELKQALLKLDAATAEGARILKPINENYTGFAAATDDDYNSIRGMMTRIGLL